ncbi:LysM peptidoglycan-binding domain-containing protein [Virgibacillus ihumii]|uniref:LysM peptidoglycan-binding domain-containing protein n=1 Tax=Virgibacillus ihumii TaxID=2686091 RepID=UPI00157CB3BF|nr:LysM peptidoglycan-binding domain-containing protein [Virgibacillus ihumii]
MADDQAVFRFDLNESLYFEKGQEVLEMMGVSLEPEISIQPFHDYISIRGVIELQGTYKRLPSNEDNAEPDNLNDYHSKRYVEKVVELEDDRSEFLHRFPVEISIPVNRVNDLNDITVDIESFDYEIPNQTQMKLSSTVQIHGIDNPQQESTVHEKEDTAFLQREDETFEFDIKEKANEEEMNSDSAEDFVSELPQMPEEEPANETVEEEERWKKKKSQSLTEFFNKDVNEKAEEEIHQNDTAPEVEITEAADPSEIPEAQTDNLEDVRYLADVFQTEEGEQYTSMRLCIVQETDTVETIADRYQISAGQLLKRNRLSNDDLKEGQLLYIPYRKS